MNFSNWQEFGIDPIELGQPVLYVNGSDINYFAGSGGTGNLVQNQHIYTMNRYNDNGLNFGKVNDTARAAYVNNTGGAGSSIGWFGQLVTAGGGYTTGTTSTLAFMNQSTACEFTVYWMFRGRIDENQGNTKIQLATSNNTGGRGIQFRIVGAGNPGTRTVGMVINNNTAGQNAVLSNIYSYQSDVSTGWKLFSWRVNAIGAAPGTTIGKGYVNGIPVVNVTLTNSLASNGTSATAPYIGNRSTNDLRYAAYLGEFIIFNTQHSEATHLKVCNYLKRKWKI